MEMLREFWTTCNTWPIFPATVLMAVVLIYWLLVILGAFDIDVLDLDFDFDANSNSILGFGFVGLRFLNLGEVPLMVWLSAFGLSWWSMAGYVEPAIPEDNWSTITWAIVRDMGVALFAAKLLTQPLKKLFEQNPPNPPEEMIGRLCLVTTSEVTDSFGHAECKTKAAPLLITVRTREETLTKGETAKIVEFDPDNHIFYIVKSNAENE